MNILFLGGVFDNTIEKEILNKSKGTVHYAANKFQWNLIDGLLAINDLNLEILSAPFIGTFPKEYENIQYKGQKSVYVVFKFTRFKRLVYSVNSIINQKNGLAPYS